MNSARRTPENEVLIQRAIDEQSTHTKLFKIGDRSAALCENQQRSGNRKLA